MPPVYAGPSGLISLFALPRPHGLGYEILAFQAIAKIAFDTKQAEVRLAENGNDASFLKGYHALFGLNVDTEILVRTKSEFEANNSDVTTLAYKIKNDGKLLYGKP